MMQLLMNPFLRLPLPAAAAFIISPGQSVLCDIHLISTVASSVPVDGALFIPSVRRMQSRKPAEFFPGNILDPSFLPQISAAFRFFIPPLMMFRHTLSPLLSLMST